MYKNHHIIAIIPARNEALSIGGVISDINALTRDDGRQIFDRILVCDNGSIDKTYEIASERGAEVIQQAMPGYGIACQTALSLIEHTDIVVFIDADASLIIDESIQLIEAILDNADLAIGARHAHLREKNSMSLCQRFGNQLARLLIRLIWQEKVSDLGPFRAVRYSALKQLDMQDLQFGWTVEMQVKAIQKDLRVIEIPIHYRRRIGQSKISGTIGGVLGAGYGIISTILKLAFNAPQEHKNIVDRNA